MALSVTAMLVGFVGVLIAIMVGWIFFPIIVARINTAGLATINDSGTVTDYSWAGTITIVLFILALALIPVSLVFLVVKGMGK